MLLDTGPTSFKSGSNQLYCGKFHLHSLMKPEAVAAALDYKSSDRFFHYFGRLSIVRLVLLKCKCVSTLATWQRMGMKFPLFPRICYPYTLFMPLFVPLLHLFYPLTSIFHFSFLCLTFSSLIFKFPPVSWGRGGFLIYTSLKNNKSLNRCETV